MIYLSSQMQTNHAERVKLYKRFDKRFVCEKGHDPFISKRDNVCGVCGDIMEEIKPKSTNHLTIEEASSLISSFVEMPQETREHIRNILGYKKLPFTGGDE